MKKKIILIGCGGHAKVCADVVLNSGKFQIAGVVCDEKKNVLNLPQIGTDKNLKILKKKYNYALITIGQIKNYQKRLGVLKKLKKLDFKIPVIISKQAITSKSAKIKSGTIVMDRAVIHQDVNIGENCIINTGAIIEHDVIIGSNSHISTGAIVNGGVINQGGGYGDQILSTLYSIEGMYGIGNQIDQDTPGFLSAGWIGAESGDRFGSVTDTGDFDGDGRMDLLVGVPEESVGSIGDAGLVHVIYGSGGWSNNAGFYQNTSGWPEASESGDRFGSALTTGDFNNDGYIDIVVGTPDETVGPAQKSGSITVLNGSVLGPIGRNSFTLNQTSPGINGVSENADLWADSLAALDLNGDGHTDLAVSSMTESIGTHFDTGAVTFIWGTKEGISQEQSLTITQDSPNVPSQNKSNDYWGRLGTSGTLSPQRPQTALKTPSGVNVSLLAKNGDDYIVRTPCGHPVVVSGGDELENIQIVIDPGHGGVDVGAAHHGLIERKLNLMIAEELVNELNLRGVKAILTRTGNYHMPLSSRGQFADHVNAAAMISIHHNAPAGAQSYEPGVETFVQTDSPLSEYLGSLVYRNTFTSLKQFTWVSWTSAADAGVIRVLNSQGTDTYGMMSRPKTPTTLVELAYIANPSEAALVKTNEYLTAVVNALADASQTFLENSHLSHNTVSTVRRYTAGEAPGYNVCFDPVLQSWDEIISKAIQQAIDDGILSEE